MFSHNLSSFLKSGVLFSLFAVVALVLCSCDLAENYTKADRAANMELQDYRDALAERPIEEDVEVTSVVSIPELQPYVSMTPSSMVAMPLVSVSVNQSVPLRDILYELAQQAEYNLELDPNIRGSIIFTVRNKPFDQVVSRIADMAGLRYKFEDSFLRVELDKPYIKTYKVDYLSFIRTNSGRVTTNVSVVSEEGGGATTGSDYTSTSDSVADFWGELEVNLAQILDGANVSSLLTKRDPRITAVAQNPDVVPLSPTGGVDGVAVQPPDAVLNVESLPVDGGDDISADTEVASTTFSINRQAGMITVFGSDRAQKEIGLYLAELKRSVTSQVLVEAKIFEVSLFDEYVNGVEWEAVSKEFAFGFLNVASSSLRTNVLSTAAGVVAENANSYVSYRGNDLNAFVQAISGFGSVRALASPRLTVLNNQVAILNVATNRVFFEIDLETTKGQDGNPDTTTVETEIKSIPEGVLINVQPSINLDQRTVSMLVRPTITKIVNTVQDPAVVGIVSRIPEVNIQEIDTVIKVNSGQPIVMGGLLQDKVENTDEAVPVLGEVPVLGNLFKKHKDGIRKTELIIFLKATIVEDGNDTIHDTDRDLYRVFSADRRPFDL